MRIAHVVPTYLPATRYGGPIYSVHGLCKALAAMGHDVHVFTTSVDGPQDSPVTHGAPVVLEGVKVWYFRSRFMRRLYWAPAMRSALEAQIGTIDIAHLHSVYLWPTNMAARIAVKRKVPYVLAPRGMLVAELIRRKNRWVKTAWLNMIESFTIEHASRLHFTSSMEQRDALAIYPELPPSFVVPNGVDLPSDSSSTLTAQRLRAAADRGPYCLFLGRINWKKGLEQLLRAVSGTGIRVLICGNAEDRYLAKIDALIRTLNLEAAVEVVGPAHGPDKWALLRRARMLVLPSINENLGNVVLEAMAAGCPVVATTGVGAAEIVQAAGAGVVCGPNDAELKQALLYLWRDEAFRSAAALRAAEFAAENLAWPSIAERVTTCYRQILTETEAPCLTGSPRWS